jgi:SAM-dependent methyltransferase
MASTAKLVCPVCEHEETFFVFAGDDRLLRTSPKIFGLYRCARCRAGFLNPQPTEDEMRQAYPAPYWWVTGGPSRSLVSRLERAYREVMLQRHVQMARRFLPCPRPRLLDVGCGSGTFLHLLRRAAGIEGEGLEVSAEAAAAARTAYGLTIHTGSIDGVDFPEASYDFITMFHVLEHLPQPRKALLKIRTWLAPKGVLLLQVPNYDSLQARLLGERWIGFDIPRHLIAFTPSSLQLLLAAAGFVPSQPHYYCPREDAPCIASSLVPSLDPVAISISQDAPFASLRKAAYFGLVLAAQPFALAEAWLKKGGMMFVAATLKDPSDVG